MPPEATKFKYGKISKSKILTPAPIPGACDVSEMWATLIWTYSPSLVTVRPPKLKYCTLFISGAELQKDRRMHGQTDGRTIQTLDAPGGPFRPGTTSLHIHPLFSTSRLVALPYPSIKQTPLLSSLPPQSTPPSLPTPLLPPSHPPSLHSQLLPPSLLSSFLPQSTPPSLTPSYEWLSLASFVNSPLCW